MSTEMKPETERAPRAVLNRAGLLFLATLALAFWQGCADEKTTSPDHVATDQCTACHASKDRLVATAAPDTTAPPENPGEG